MALRVPVMLRAAMGDWVAREFADLRGQHLAPRQGHYQAADWPFLYDV